MTDARLLLPAAGSWLGAVVVVVGSRAIWPIAARYQFAGHVLLAVAAVATALGCAALVALRQSTRVRREWTIALILAVAALLVGAASGAVHVRALSSPPVAAWIDARATATVTGIISSTPVVPTGRAAAPWASAASVEVRLASATWWARGERWAVQVPVVLSLSEGDPVPPVGTSVRVAGRLSPASPSADAAARLTVARPRRSGAAIEVVGPPGPVDRLTGTMRSGLQSALRATPADAGALVAGLAIGDESGQSADLRTAMQRSGLSHLTAVSGGNVSIVVVATLMIVSALRLALAVRVVVAVVSLAFFVVLVGPAPSVIRAAVMAGLVLLGMLVGGRRAGPSVLATAVLVLAIAAPGLAATWGFALSAGATAGLILLSSPLQRRLAAAPRLGRLPPAVRDALAVTVAAQLATAPLLVAMGAPVGWVAVPANLLAMPVVGPVTVLGLMAAAVSAFLPGVAVLLAHVASWPAAWIARVAFTCSQLPGARVPWPAGAWGVALLVVVVISGVLLRTLLRHAYPLGIPAPVTVAASCLLAVLVVGWTVVPPDRRSWPPSGWLMIMCDIGQGDALLLHAADGSAVAVDAGPDPQAADRCLHDAGITALPAVVLTHFHADHVGGLAGLLRGRSVGALLATPIRDPPEEAALVDQVAAEHGLAVSPISAGDIRTAGAVTWRALWPRRRIASGSVPNNASVVLAVVIDGRSMLLMGDVEPEAQAALAGDLRGQHVDVVKVPHHGSRYQHPLLTRWAPASVALVSVGAGNDYGHPAAETIAAWRAIGALVARTDLVGDVAVVPSASGVEVVVRHGMLPSS